MTLLSHDRMNSLLTMPYRRGAETQHLRLGSDVSGWTTVDPYNFVEYVARYGESPAEPRYIIFPLSDLGRDPIDIEAEFESPGGSSTTTVTVRIPSDTRRMTSFFIPYPAGSDPSWELRRFRQLLVPLPGPGCENWGIDTLLGNIAKLSWILGREKDDIRWHLRDIHRQRTLTSDEGAAHGVSLDLLGEDLRVLRFPPREYSFDLDTIALYHLNEAPGDPDPVVDATGNHRLPPQFHNGTNQNAVRAATGVLSYGYSFPAGDGSDAVVEISHHSDFNIGVDDSFTVDLFVQPSSAILQKPMAIITKGMLDDDGLLTGKGWAVTIGSFRGFDLNLRFEVVSGAHRLSLFADKSFDDERVHHIAAVIDRAAARLRLYVDGRQVATQVLTGVGAVSNTTMIRIGRSRFGHQFFGTIDEIRLSSAARGDFFPVLGEGDDAYRRRLTLFEKWLLPTPDAILKAINDQVTINGDSEPFVLIETDRPSARADRLVRIFPENLPAGQSIDREGNMRADEAAVCGCVKDDILFNEIYLFRHDVPEVDYGTEENNRMMPLTTLRAFDKLLGIMKSEMPLADVKISMHKSFDPQDEGLHAIGRAILISHPDLSTLPNEKLAVYTLKAGFDFVTNTGSQVYASVAPGEMLGVELGYDLGDPKPGDGTDMHIGQSITLKVAPDDLPLAGDIQWTVIRCGYGDGTLLGTVNDPTVTFKAMSPGNITVQVRYTYQRRTVFGFSRIRIGLATLGAGEMITAQGMMGSTEEDALGAPDDYFAEQYLLMHDRGLDYGGDSDHQRMQVILVRTLDRLIELLPGAANELTVDKAFDATYNGAHQYNCGRAIRLHHATMSPNLLAALAHAAGFGFVELEGTSVYCSVAAGELIDIVRTSDKQPIGDIMEIDADIDIEVVADTLPDVTDYNWSVDVVGNGDGQYSSLLRRQTTFTPTEPGLAIISVTYVERDPDTTFPYSFEIRLKPSLDPPPYPVPSSPRPPYIAKHDYDVVMNILNCFHPIGIQVGTRNIREHVIELKGGNLSAAPDYTYPGFRDSERSIVVSDILKRIRSEHNG